MIDGRLEAQFTVPVCSATANGAVFLVPSGTYYLSDFLVALAARLNQGSSSTWTVSLSTGSNGTGQITINNSTSPWSFAFGSSALGSLLGFASDIVSVSAPQTGAAQARTIWIPDTPLAVDGDPRVAPIADDKRETITPLGRVGSLVGNRRYIHTNVRWTGVPAYRTWAKLEVLANQSWERWMLDTQVGPVLGDGSTFVASPSLQDLRIWITPRALVRVYDSTGSSMGGSGVVNGWSFLDFTPPQMWQPPSTRLWAITIPRAVSQLDG